MFFTVSPPGPSISTAFEVVTLNITALDEDFVNVFDSIEVWRSRGTEGGPYEELTGNLWRGARIPSAGLDPPEIPETGPTLNVVGLKLEFLLNEKDEVSITFTGSDPLTFSQAAVQIMTQSLGRLRAWVDENVKLIVETAEPGTGATLRILPSDAVSLLGLPTTAPDDFAFGTEARLQLLGGVNSYNFNDKTGARTYFYKTRFRNRFNNTASEFSPTYSALAVGIDVTSVITGYLDLIALDGTPLVGIEVSLRAPFIGQLIAGKLVAGQDLLKKTDVNGHVEFTLVRGQTYTLAISGTNIAKEIVTPANPAITSFLLVDDSFATQDDYFHARVPQIPTMERRSF